LAGNRSRARESGPDGLYLHGRPNPPGDSLGQRQGISDTSTGAGALARSPAFAPPHSAPVVFKDISAEPPRLITAGLQYLFDLLALFHRGSRPVDGGGSAYEQSTPDPVLSARLPAIRATAQPPGDPTYQERRGSWTSIRQFGRYVIHYCLTYLDSRTVGQEFAVDQAAVRQLIVRTVANDRPHLANVIQKEFGVSRPTAYNYVRRAIDDELIVRTGLGKYELVHQQRRFTHLVEGLEEHAVWANEIAPNLVDLPPNVVDIWHYGCTVMINNVIDHSESEAVHIDVNRSAVSTEISVHDDGVGIFRKIAKALNLDDDRHSVLELSKGKVTTDPENHTGEGIFFSSRAFDKFAILSGAVFFEHERDDEEDWILGDERQRDNADGTSVFMALSNDSERRLPTVFDTYATDTEDYRFDKTVVPVKLLQYGDDRLVSRSQAKRLLNRFDRFRMVVLNFRNVESIGQAFADEVFRVFPSQHPEIDIVAIHTNEQVSRMMRRAMDAGQPQRDLFTGADRQAN